MSKYLIVIEDRDLEFIIDVEWDINIPNNLSEDEMIEEYMVDNYGYIEYHSYKLDNMEHRKLNIHYFTSEDE